MDWLPSHRSSLTNSTCDARQTETIRIAVFDNNRLFRAGIVHMLNAEPDMEVVLEGGSAFDLAEVSVGFSPDITILDTDVMIAETNLWYSIHRIYPAMDILGMASNLDREGVQAASAIGVRGCILKGASVRELVEAVRTLHRKENNLSPAVGAKTLADVGPESGMKHTKAGPLAQLTFREGEIFRLLAAGLKNREIGRHLGVTEKTIKCYVTRIFEKLHVRNRVEAAMLSTLDGDSRIVPKERRISIATPNLCSSLASRDYKCNIPVDGGRIAGGTAGSNGGSLPQRSRPLSRV